MLKSLEGKPPANKPPHMADAIARPALFDIQTPTNKCSAGPPFLNLRHSNSNHFQPTDALWLVGLRLRICRLVGHYPD